MALQLLEAAAVRIETRSKAERGFGLLGTNGPMLQAVCVGPITLNSAVRVEAALSVSAAAVSPIFSTTNRPH